MAIIQDTDLIVVGRGVTAFQTQYSNLKDRLTTDLSLIPEAPTDGNIYARKGDTGTWVRALPYDATTLPELPS